MRYIMLIYNDESGYETATEAQMAEVMAAYAAFDAEARTQGVLLSGEALHLTRTATTVRLRDGKMMTTDGPFAETKETLGAYFLLNCKDLDEALTWAAKIPEVKFGGSVEVRPIMEFN